MKRIGSLSLAIALVCATAGGAAAQTAERGPLSWRLQEGDEHHYAFSWALKVDGSVAGAQKMALGGLDALVAMTLTHRIKKVEGGLATVEATITSVKAKQDASVMGMPMPTAEYDSLTGKASMPVLEALKEAVGKAFTFKLDTSGKVTEVTGGDAIQEAVGTAMQKLMAGGMGGMGGMGGGMGGMGGGMGGMGSNLLLVAFGDQALESTLNVLNHVLPEGGSAAPDATWSHEVVEGFPQLGELRFTGRYKNDGASGSKTRISFKPDGEVTLERVEEEGADPQLAELRRQMADGQTVTKTAVRGVATFGDGALVDSEVVQEIETESKLPAMMQMQFGEQGKDMRMGRSYGLTLRYERKDAPPAAVSGDGEQGGEQGGGASSGDGAKF